ncbi:MAG: transcriptional regulator [Acidimicrobiia bacterium]|nr:transcriptional regulator [Acidimicrobiia bacterium]MYB25355.1 transcriptional regulator [Acidimicrobiia bacterium]MYE67039.1 transcriptional regulator [Acidimicrobiia bacterium]MYJ13846.1 transcriptional regulator [Acidimicrobiia bacterium]
MTYSDEEIRRRLALGEDSGWEFKAVEFAGDRPKSPSRDDLADEIAAFANADGGTLLCGVSDDGRPQDMSRRQIVALDNLLVEVATDAVRPPVRIRTHHRQVDGAALLLVSIPEGDALHDSPGGGYVRVGGTKRRMTSDERLRLSQRRGQARFRSYDERTVPGTGFETLEETLWRPMLSAEGSAEPEAALSKLALLSNDEAGVQRATVAGVLLCTQNPERWLPGAAITATLYRGGDRTSGQIDAQEITGPLNRQIGAAMAFVVRNMRVAARKAPARVDLPQYSERALFEAIVNAVVHRDYAVRVSRIRLSMFEDRLELQSPGSLPNNLTLESMQTRQATRNEVLASVLGRLPVAGIRGSEERSYIMERRGDGVPVILRRTRELCGATPEYRLIDGAEVLLTVPAAPLEASAARAVITVRSAGRPLPGADVLALFPNGTYQRASADENGEAAVELHTTHLPMAVFAAAAGYGGRVVRDWVPSRRALAVELEALQAGGSVVFAESAGYLPRLKGRLNPVRDSHDRTYLYASDIAIDGGKNQPVHFALGEDLRLTDADGAGATVRIVDLVGRSALLEYRPVT